MLVAWMTACLARDAQSEHDCDCWHPTLVLLQKQCVMGQSLTEGLEFPLEVGLLAGSQQRLVVGDGVRAWMITVKHVSSVPYSVSSNVDIPNALLR